MDAWGSSDVLTAHAALMRAAEAGDVSGVAAAVEQGGARVNERDDKGRTALHVSSACGHVGAVQCLLALGADPTICDSRGNTPLHLAATSGRAEVVRCLLSSDKGGAAFAVDGTGRTPLHWAYDRLHRIKSPTSSLADMQRQLQEIIDSIHDYVSRTVSPQEAMALHHHLQSIAHKVTAMETTEDVDEIEKMLTSLSL